MPNNHSSSIALLLVLTTIVLHLLIAPGVDLSVDEAHYALYAHFLDWSYYDHPPMVGWLLWLTKPLGWSELTLRLPSALIYAVCSALIYHISSHRLQRGSPQKGLLAVVLFTLCPMVQILGFGLVPEFPLLMWVLLLALLVERLGPDSSPSRWLGLGCLLGLAGLSKYTAVLLLPGLLFYWSWNRQLWAILTSPGLYLAAFAALLLITPVLAWNYQHDWASFSYQLDHAAGGEWDIVDALRALLVQLITYSPLVVIGGFIAFRDAIQPGLRGLLACLAIPVIMLVLFGAGNGASLPHWSLVGWTLLIPSVSIWVIDAWSRPGVRRLAIFATAFSLTVSSLFLLLVTFKPLGSLPSVMVPGVAAGLRDLTGWREAAQRGNQLLEEQLGGDGVLLVSNWSRASRIAWYARPSPVQVLDRRGGQFAYWYGEPDATKPGILIRDDLDEDDQPREPYLKQGMTCVFLEDAPVVVEGVEINRFFLYRCGGTEP